MALGAIEVKTRTREHRGVKYNISLAHPAADEFPWHTEDELDDLVRDLRQTKVLRIPIVRLDDLRVIDGRNRELACLVAGVKPDYVQFPTFKIQGVEPTEEEIRAEVLRLNVRR